MDANHEMDAVAQPSQSTRRQVMAGFGALALGSFGLLAAPDAAFAELKPAVGAERHGRSHRGRHNHYRRHHRTHHGRKHR
jgi:hypothetical protein